MALNANDLRKFAEAVDSTRNEEMFFQVKNGALVRVGNRPLGGEYLAVKTEWHGDGLKGGSDVALSVTGSSGKIPGTADAAFISQSAFEKFVLPYYIRTRSPNELTSTFKSVYKKDVVCLYHEITSEPTTMGRKKGGIFALHKDGKRKLI
jgi:hypothetical protein